MKNVRIKKFDEIYELTNNNEDRCRKHGCYFYHDSRLLCGEIFNMETGKAAYINNVRYPRSESLYIITRATGVFFLHNPEKFRWCECWFDEL